MRRRVVAWLLLGHACGCLAQTTLSVPSKTQEQVSSAQPPVALSIPQAPTLNLSVALCSTETPFPRFFVNPGSPVSNPSIDNAGQEIFLDGGVAFWNGGGPATFYALLEPGSNGARSFEVGLTNSGKLFRDVSMRRKETLTRPHSSYISKKFNSSVVWRLNCNAGDYILSSIPRSSV